MALNLNLTGNVSEEEAATTQYIDQAQYMKQVDNIDASDLIYTGEAVPGSATSSPVWRIKKINLNNGTDSDIEITFADGNASFDNIWDNRLTLSYS